MKKSIKKYTFKDNKNHSKQGLAATSSSLLLIVASILLFLLSFQFLQFFIQLGLSAQESASPKIITILDKQNRFEEVFHQEFLTEAAQGSIHNNIKDNIQRLSFDVDLFFDWGIDTLNENGKDILLRMIDVLHISGDTYSRYEQLQIEAFPDLNKIASELSANDRVDSWELASARSDNVLAFLNIHAKEYFDTSIFTNTTYLHQHKESKDLTKKQNRKIDFILVYAAHFKE